MNEKTWSMLCHLSSLVMFLGVPFGNILGPLVIWLIKKDTSPAVSEHGKESLNFQISMTLYLIAAVVVTVVLTFVLIGILLWPLLWAILVIGPFIDVALVIVATIKASDGQFFRYPITIRFIT